MAYILNLFTPETWAAFRKNDAIISGFSERQKRMAHERISLGDIFLCYMVRLSRWCGALEIVSEAYEDSTPIFRKPDPYIIRFKVKPLVVLDPEQSIPIFEPEIWNRLSDTRNYEIGTSSWTGAFRSSLREIPEEDGEFLLSRLQRQNQEKKEYPFSDRDLRRLARRFTVRTPEGEVSVEVPDEDEEDATEGGIETNDVPPEGRLSIQIQAKVAEIGATMGFRIWVPRNDKARVLEYIPETLRNVFLETLPLNYDDTTLTTIENIDVLWLQGRAIARAFEIEHTTAVY